jgi:hypothetical protein
MKKSVWRGITALGLTWVLAASGAVADVVMIAPAKDNTLYEHDPGASNGIGEFLFSGETNFAMSRRALLAFDVAGNVPAGATIDGVTLTLHVSQAAPTGTPSPFALHEVLADWGEAGSNAGTPGGLGAPAQPGDATWSDRFFTTNLWTNPGGDFDATASGSILVDPVGFYAWSGPGLAADVQGWLDGPATNFGWILVGDEADTGQARRFDSRENANPAFQPVLEIVYTPAPAGPVPTVSEWGLIFLALMFLTAGTLLFGRAHRATMRTGTNTVSLAGDRPVFDVRLYTRVLAVVFGLLAIGIGAASVLTGPPSAVDVTGSLLCAPVAAYLLHLWIGARRG